MALATALLDAVACSGSLERWVSSRPTVTLLEINRAGDLTPWFDRLPNHLLIEFPEADIHNLPFPDDHWDVVVHSDTLEHVDDPLVALTECRRVMRPAGALCFTIPILPGRMTRRRDGMPPSYHGSEELPMYRVVTEYGADFWPTILDAGFGNLQLVADYWPDALALIAREAGPHSDGPIGGRSPGEAL
jgi:SAM-dependent methyltransferase